MYVSVGWFSVESFLPTKVSAAQVGPLLLGQLLVGDGAATAGRVGSPKAGADVPSFPEPAAWFTPPPTQSSLAWQDARSQHLQRAI